MDLKIIEKIEEPLLSRTRIISEVTFENSIPSNKEVKSKIASLLKADENLLVVKSIYTNFGFKKAKVNSCLYNDEKEMGIIEIKPKKDVKEKKSETKEDKPQVKEEKESKEEKPKTQEKPKEKVEK